MIFQQQKKRISGHLDTADPALGPFYDIDLYSHSNKWTSMQLPEKHMKLHNDMKLTLSSNRKKN